MASTPVLISVEEYLHTVYRPDCDYVDGEVLERNMGERPHARLQKFFTRFFEQYEDVLQIETLPEQRLQISTSRFRIPDVMLVRLDDGEPRIIRSPPLLCIEILSSEDRMRKVQERLDDYASMGVGCMWVIDPWRGTAFAAGRDGKLHETADRLSVEGTPISITVAEIFAELERLERRGSSASA